MPLSSDAHSARPRRLRLFATFHRRPDGAPVGSMKRRWILVGRFRPQRSIDAAEEVRVLKRLDQIGECSGLQRLRSGVLIVKRSDEDNRDLVTRRTQFLLQLEAVQPRHLYIENQAGGLLQLLGGEK